MSDNLTEDQHNWVASTFGIDPRLYVGGVPANVADEGQDGADEVAAAPSLAVDDAGATGGASVGQTTSDDSNTLQATVGEPQTMDVPAASQQDAPLASAVASPTTTATDSFSDPGTTSVTPQETNLGQNDPATTGTDALKRINVTIVTSYGQTVSYWMQDRATDANNEAPEGSGTVLVNGDAYGPGESIVLTCIETANGASICYQRESYPNPPGGGMTQWSSVYISDGDTFTIQETAQILGAPSAAAGGPVDPSGDDSAPRKLETLDRDDDSTPSTPMPNLDLLGIPTEPAGAMPITQPVLASAATSQNPYDGTGYESAWQLGFDDGSTVPSGPLQPPGSFNPDQADAYSKGVQAAQEIGQKTPANPPSPPSPNVTADHNESAPDKSVDPSVRPPISGSGSAINPYAGTELADPWAEGFEDGSSRPDGAHSAPAPYGPDAQTAYSEGVLAGQTAVNPAPQKSTTDKSDQQPAPPASDPSDQQAPQKEGEWKDTAFDIAKSKGLVAAGEFIAGKVGGIVGYAVDLATSPGGDTTLMHSIYQAVLVDEDNQIEHGLVIGGMTVPVPNADWHRKRENAEKDAAAHTAKTGQKTAVEESYSKDNDDID